MKDFYVVAYDVDEKEFESILELKEENIDEAFATIEIGYDFLKEIVILIEGKEPLRKLKENIDEVL